MENIYFPVLAGFEEDSLLAGADDDEDIIRPLRAGARPILDDDASDGLDMIADEEEDEGRVGCTPQQTHHLLQSDSSLQTVDGQQRVP